MKIRPLGQQLQRAQPLRIDLSIRAPEVDWDDPDACPCCKGAGRHRQVADGTNEYGEPVRTVTFVDCEACHRTGIADG